MSISALRSISRGQSIAIAFGTVVCSLLLGIAYLRYSTWGTPVPKVLTSADVIPESESALTLGDFHRSEYRDGTLIWDIKAVQGEYFPESGKAVLKEPKILFMDKKNQEIRMNAPKGIVTFKEGNALDKAHASGGVLITIGEEESSDKKTIVSEKLIFVADESLVTTSYPVRITSKGYLITGKGLAFNTESETLVIESDVYTYFSDTPAETK